MGIFGDRVVNMQTVGLSHFRAQGLDKKGFICAQAPRNVYKDGPYPLESLYSTTLNNIEPGITSQRQFYSLSDFELRKGITFFFHIYSIRYVLTTNMYLVNLLNFISACVPLTSLQKSTSAVIGSMKMSGFNIAPNSAPPLAQVARKTPWAQAGEGKMWNPRMQKPIKCEPIFDGILGFLTILVC